MQIFELVKFKIFFRHEEKIKHGKTHTLLGVLRYATNKEITSIFSLYFPLYSYYGFDFDANVTVPNMEPCVLNFSLTEISRKTYGVSYCSFAFYKWLKHILL